MGRTRAKMMTCALFVVAGAAVVPPVQAASLKVPQSYQTIQEAIDKAQYGDRVVVSPGTYEERLTLRDGVSVEGQPTAEQPVRLVGPGSGSVVTMSGVGNLTFSGLELSGAGAGASDALLWMDNAYPTVRDNTFLESPSAAILLASSSDPLIEENRLERNSRGIVLRDASDARIRYNTFTGQSGAAIDVGAACFPDIIGNDFDQNDQAILAATGSAPAILENTILNSLADAVVLDGASPLVQGNLIAGSSGAGLLARNGAQPSVQDNRFDRNQDGVDITFGSPLLIDNWFTLQSGAGVVLRESAFPALLQNLFQDNASAVTMQGSAGRSASPHIFNNTFVGGTGTAIVLIDQAFPALDNNIIAYNDGYGILCDGNSMPTLAYNDFYENSLGHYGGHCDEGMSTTDLAVDPGFVAFSDDGDPENDDLHLQETSPVIDAGNPLEVYNDDDGTRNDMGAYGGSDHPSFLDMDGDGYTTDQGDCNDANPRIHPGAEEIEDGIDNDCDGREDETPGPGDDDDDATGDDDDGTGDDDDATGDDDDGTGDDDDASGDDDDASGDDDDASGDDDDATGDDDDDDGDASPTDFPETEYGEGCNCRVTGKGSPPARGGEAMLGLLLVGAVAIRRRGR